MTITSVKKETNKFRNQIHPHLLKRYELSSQSHILHWTCTYNSYIWTTCPLLHKIFELILILYVIDREERHSQVKVCGNKSFKMSEKGSRKSVWYYSVLKLKYNLHNNWINNVITQPQGKSQCLACNTCKSSVKHVLGSFFGLLFRFWYNV